MCAGAVARGPAGGGSAVMLSRAHQPRVPAADAEIDSCVKIYVGLGYHVDG